jgi:cell division protein FtsQ
LQGINAERNLVLNNYRHMSELIAGLGLSVRSLALSERQAWDLTLSNGIQVVLGKDNVYQRLQRFINVYPQVIGVRSSEVNYVDMRYPNGMAVSFKQTPVIKEG